jgi:hypothetical protein
VHRRLPRLVQGNFCNHDKQLLTSICRCGVNIISSDYTNPDDMKLFVWSWDQQEPKFLNSSTHCVAMLPTGRWAALDCSTALPYACAVPQSNGQYTNSEDAHGMWNINLDVTGIWLGDKAPCNVGYVPSVPHNGFTNAILSTKSFGQTLWLNTPLMF